MRVVAIDVDLSAEHDGETDADLADRRQRLAGGEAADLAEAPRALDIRRIEMREDLVTARFDYRRVVVAHVTFMRLATGANGPAGRRIYRFLALSGYRSGSTARRRKTLIAEDDAAMVRRPMGPAGRRQSDGAMGRSQVVRQRILIPPFPGSNPGAPASVVNLPPASSKTMPVSRLGCLRVGAASPAARGSRRAPPERRPTAACRRLPDALRDSIALVWRISPR